MSKPGGFPDCILAKRVSGSGYGLIRVSGKTLIQSRHVYCEHNNVTIESIKGLLVRHKCDNPPCINPEHLEIGTHRDNSRDMVERGRAVNWNGKRKGEGNPKAKVTQKEVDEMRKRYVKYSRQHGSTALAKDYGISKRAAFDIVDGTCWK